MVCFTDRKTGLSADVSLQGGGVDGDVTTRAVALMAQEWPGLFRPLALFLKIALAQRGLNKPFTGGLGSFKALGGAYAVATVLSAELSRRGAALSASAASLAGGQYSGVTGPVTATCATDGNHGRSVAWAAWRFHCRCVIFVHETVSQGRVDAIAAFGADCDKLTQTQAECQTQHANCQ